LYPDGDPQRGRKPEIRPYSYGIAQTGGKRRFPGRIGLFIVLLSLLDAQNTIYRSKAISQAQDIVVSVHFLMMKWA